MQVYELTESGERLRPALYCMGAWGRDLPLPADADREGARAELIALGLAGTSPPQLSAELDETYEFHVADECFHLTAVRGCATVRSGPAPRADLIVECDLGTFIALVGDELTASQAIAQGRLSIRGERARLSRALRILDYTHAAKDFRLVPA